MCGGWVYVMCGGRGICDVCGGGVYVMCVERDICDVCGGICDVWRRGYMWCVEVGVYVTLSVRVYPVYNRGQHCVHHCGAPPYLCIYF